MLNPQERITLIRERLETTFSPSYLEVIDDSAAHAGHAGAQSGAGHFTVKITCDAFDGQTKVSNHRAIYQVLHDLIPEEIHALSIHIL
jgi:BolA family transcriptional regulator, general stress-responsive regulator